MCAQLFKRLFAYAPDVQQLVRRGERAVLLPVGDYRPAPGFAYAVKLHKFRSMSDARDENGELQEVPAESVEAGDLLELLPIVENG